MAVQSIRPSNAISLPPPPPPRVETLRAATPEAANRAIAGMDAAAAAALAADVQAMPASERHVALNELATRLDAGNLRRMHAVFGSEAVTDAVVLRSGIETREAYMAPFADAMARGNPDFAWDIFGLQSALPASPSAREAMLRDYLEGNYGAAFAVAEAASPGLYGEVAQLQERARADYERNGFEPSYELALGNVLIRNEDPAYRAEMIRLLHADGRLALWGEGLAGYGGDRAEAARASLDDAVEAGVIDRSTADGLQAALA